MAGNYVVLEIEQLKKIATYGMEAVEAIAKKEGVTAGAVKRSVTNLFAADKSALVRSLAEQAHERLLADAAKRGALSKGTEKLVQEGSKKVGKKALEKGGRKAGEQALKKAGEQGAKTLGRSGASLLARFGALSGAGKAAVIGGVVVGVIVVGYLVYRAVRSEPLPSETAHFSGLGEAVEGGLQTGPAPASSPFAEAMRRGQLVAAKEEASASVDLTSWSGMWVPAAFQETWLDRVYVRQDGVDIRAEFESPYGYVLGDGQGGKTVIVPPGDHTARGRLENDSVRLDVSDGCAVTLTLVPGGESISARVEAEGGGALGHSGITLVRKAAPPAWSGVEPER